MKVSIIVVSDTAFQDKSTDGCSATLETVLAGSRLKYAETLYVPDDISAIQKAIKGCMAVNNGGVVLTAGGTGFGERDVTPEAVKPLIEREAPGIVHAMLAASLKVTPFATMSRPLAGVYKNAMVVTLPGKPKAAAENLEAIIQVLPHAVELITGGDSRKIHAEMAKSNGNGHGHHHRHHIQGNHHHEHGHGGHKHDHAPGKHRHAHGGHSGPKFHELLSNDTDQPVSARQRQSPFPMTPVPDALERIREHIPEPEVITKAITDDLVGYVVAGNVASQINVPSFRASIVDGYAVMHSDGPGTYDVKLISHAQPDAPSEKLTSQEIARITTGAALPDGATAVVPVEETTVDVTDENGEEKRISILAKGVEEGDNVREIGSDVKKGDIVVAKGTRVTTNGGVVGLLASVGVAEIKVFRKPVVGVMSTGNELVDICEKVKNPERALSGGEIWDSNRPAMISMVKGYGYEVVDFGIINDTVAQLESKIKSAFTKVDLLITSGGVSMGETDLLKPTIERKLGGTIHFGRVAMKPGKPTTFATFGGSNAIFALPGNPASAIVTFHLFVLPALKKWSGLEQSGSAPTVKVALETAVHLDPVRPEYHRVTVHAKENGKLVARSTGGQRSSRVGSLKGANALLCLPAAKDTVNGRAEFAPGELVDAILIGEL
ncbi:hypothetical protein TRVA0_007S01420 [Trichomonascus vanleenenianus]|uniref:bifunctional molybdopterin adenylyltransferase MobB/molybdopterin molybdotransferase MoeA family protein n=1 Tax=Trichomonascus vanleenenianus TaxID=2268995 RepID=UPI003ECB3AEE